MKKIIYIILALIMAISSTALFGCNAKGGETDNENHVIEIKETDKYIYKNGVSEYSIVYPEQASAQEMTALSELVHFLELSLDYKFATVSDENVTEANGKYISVGHTSLLKASGERVTEQEFGHSGYRIFTKGESVFISGSDGAMACGTIYGVYGFLEIAVGYKYYHETEIEYNRSSQLKFSELNVTEKPDFNKRELGGYYTATDATYRMRLRLTTPYNAEWLAFGHTLETHLLPQSTYYPLHPDWYGDDSNHGKRQLCFTNKEMQAALIERCKYYIDKNPDGKYMSIGQNDAPLFCQCANCTAALKDYGTISGVMMVCMNGVVKELNKYVADKYPGRKITYYVFAYQTTEAPPVKLDNETGEYVPYHSDVVPVDNLGVMIAPTNLAYGHSLNDSINSATLASFKGWQAICKEISLWSYCFYANSNLIPFDGFYAMQENYKKYKELGIDYVFEEGANVWVKMGFEHLRSYLQSHLMWNTDSDVEALTKDFMEHFYKDAAAEMTEYYDLLNSWYGVLREETDLHGKLLDIPDEKAVYWPSGLLEQFENIFNKALEKIEGYKTTDPEKYQLLFDRIKLEQIMTMYLQLKFYSGSYDTRALTQRVDDFEYYTRRYNIQYYDSTSKTIEEFVADLRSKLI